MGLFQVVSFPVRFALFLLTLPIRIVFGVDFNWGIL